MVVVSLGYGNFGNSLPAVVFTENPHYVAFSRGDLDRGETHFMRMNATKHQTVTDNHGYSALQRFIEVSGITVFFALSSWSFAQLVVVTSVGSLDGCWGLIGMGVLGGLLFADFISGFVHWAADNWGDPDWPIVGTGFIRPFRYHHEDPLALTRHGFVELNGNNCIVALLVVGPSLSMGAEPTAASFLGTVFWLSVAFWVLLTNQVHAWAHLPEVSGFVYWLQRSKLVLGPDHHHIHHQPPHNRNYCITNGWMNPILNALHFFELLEGGMTTLTGLLPLHNEIQGRTESSNPQPLDG